MFRYSVYFPTVGFHSVLSVYENTLAWAVESITVNINLCQSHCNYEVIRCWSVKPICLTRQQRWNFDKMTAELNVQVSNSSRKGNRLVVWKHTWRHAGLPLSSYDLQYCVCIPVHVQHSATDWPELCFSGLTLSTCCLVSVLLSLSCFLDSVLTYTTLSNRN